jgi:pimeloyl-ACP methyl ester carboxylesterase
MRIQSMPSGSDRGEASFVHTAEVQEVYERVLAGTSVRARHVSHGAGGRVHLLEKGSGRPVVILSGTGDPAGFLLPLLDALDGVHVIAPDRPGIGLSDPVELPIHRYREAAVSWLDGLLDALGLETAALVGHSGGGAWALWFALARPERVTRLMLMGVPTLPGTRCPLPIRLMTTPVLGAVLRRLVPPSPSSFMQLARAVGEGETIGAHPDLIDLVVAVARDPTARRATRAEFRVLVSPLALFSRDGFRRHGRVRPEELGGIAMPTSVVWGERDPLGSIAVAQAVTGLIPDARLEVLPTGHGPWLGEPERTAGVVRAFAGARGIGG